MICYICVFLSTRVRIPEERLLKSLRPSVCQHVTTRESLDVFSWNFILRSSVSASKFWLSLNKSHAHFTLTYTRVHRGLKRSQCRHVFIDILQEHNLTWRLKAGILEPKETHIARQLLGKYVSATTPNNGNIFERLCFLWDPPRGYKTWISGSTYWHGGGQAYDRSND
jgi:hypothetical protein